MTRDQLARLYALRANYWLCRALHYERRAKYAANRQIAAANLYQAKAARKTALAVYSKLFKTGSDER